MSFSTNSDLLNTILIIVFRFKKSLPVLVAKSQKRDVTAYIKMTEYVDFTLSDLVSMKSFLSQRAKETAQYYEYEFFYVHVIIN